MSKPEDPRQAALNVLLRHGQAAQPATPPTVDNDGGEVLISHRPPPGEAVPMRKRLGPHTWVHAAVWPGDSRYPWPDPVSPRNP